MYLDGDSALLQVTAVSLEFQVRLGEKEGNKAISSVSKSLKSLLMLINPNFMCQGPPGLMGHPGMDGPRGPKGSAGTVEMLLF